MFSVVITGGEIIPEHPLDTILKGGVKEIPLMIGHTKDEIPMYVFSLMTADEENVKKALDTVRVTLQKERVPNTNI